MTVVKSLIDVIRKGPTPEDRCTNALVWLLQRCSPPIAREMLNLAGLDVGENREPPVAEIQPSLTHSRPDAMLHFPGSARVLLETKIHPGMCSESQLRNHYRGAARRFGDDNLRMLFLSVEHAAPSAVVRLARQLPERVFYLSWQQVLRFLDAKRSVLDHEQQVYLEEFFACIRAERLWRLFSMTVDELKAWLGHYPNVLANQEAAKNLLNGLLGSIRIQAVAVSGERAEDVSSEDSGDQLPCLYSALKIKQWHTNFSAYVFVNAALNKTGVVLTGYQDDQKEKDAFLSRWHASLRDRFTTDPDLSAFIWAKEEDEVSGETGYFKHVAGTAGQSFDPSKIEIFGDYFYWGYWRDLEVSDFTELSKHIAEDFRKLLETFCPASPDLRKQTGRVKGKAGRIRSG